MDLVLKLRELRKVLGLKQKDVALATGLGVKTISSFETGERIGSLKVEQLEKILDVYGITPGEFFGNEIDGILTSSEHDDERFTRFEVIDGVRRLPTHVRRRLLSQFRTMVRSESTRKSPTARYEPEWSLMTSPN